MVHGLSQDLQLLHFVCVYGLGHVKGKTTYLVCLKSSLLTQKFCLSCKGRWFSISLWYLVSPWILYFTKRTHTTFKSINIGSEPKIVSTYYNLNSEVHSGGIFWPRDFHEMHVTFLHESCEKRKCLLLPFRQTGRVGLENRLFYTKRTLKH